MTADTQPTPTPQPTKKRRLSLCVGCGSQITDQFILRVAPDLEWHASCLKCADCNQFLDETCTCFVREGKTYCKRDYTRLFGQRCDKCDTGFGKNDFVMRAKNKVYHIDCFRCVACSRQLIPGDEFALREDGLFCKADNDVMDRASNKDDNDVSDVTSPGNNNNHNTENKNKVNNNVNNNSSNNNKNNNINNNIDDEKGLSPTGRNEQVSTGKNGMRPHVHKSEQKPTRVRTVLNEKQLHTLRTCYNANPRPDALMKEQLVEMTGLSPRVIRVWFQNKRCKDKKRSILMKQMQHHAQEKMNSFDTMDSDDSPPHNDFYSQWHMRDEYLQAPDSVNTDYGDTPSDLSSPMSQ
ncbi:hypothetical protein ACJMK2_044244 [Sinanodonta woodiana]|uniref:Insulin gene enhancer protein ISL-1 n=1 Tax=Sinanodonta woodiana TaxID=1069815 RepID=A0ABD3W191_SINWO